MEQESKYNIYTDASFDDSTKLGTYAIVIIQENKIIKVISKKCRIKLENSLECEIFAIYQAINVISSCFLNKNKLQKFYIKTDCAIAREFFINKNNRDKIFNRNLELSIIMKKSYEKVSKKLERNKCSFKIKWIPRESNKIAHKYSYSTFQKLKVIDEKRDLLLIDKKSFIEILLKLSKIQYKIIVYLIDVSNVEKIIIMTQKEIAEELNISICEINKSFKEFINLSILEKIKNGKYALLI